MIFNHNTKVKFCFTILFFGCVLFSFSQKTKPELPEWRKFLNRTYSLVFTDSYAGKMRLDSLIRDGRKRGDIEKTAHYNEVYALVNLFQNDTLQAKTLFRKSEAYFKANNDFVSLGEYEARKAVIIMNKLKFNEAEGYFLRAIAYYEKQSNEDYLTPVYYRLGSLYIYDNRQADAIKMYTTGLKLAEKTKNTYLMFNGNLNLGMVMMDISTDEKTGHYLLKAKDYATELKDSIAISNALYYLSSYYQARQEMDRAFLYARKALEHVKGKLNSPFYGSLSGMMAHILLAAHKPDSAIIFADRALERCINDQNKSGILDAKSVMVLSYLMQNNPAKAREMAVSCLPLMQELGYTATVAGLYKSLAEAEFKLGQTNSAYSHLGQFVKINDSIFKTESQKQMAQVEASFQNEKKQIQIEALNKDMAARNQRINQQNKQKIAMGIGLVVALGFIFFIYKGYKQKQKDNQLIKLQRDKMEEQKTLVEEKNTEIMDSINYAKRLQDAILPSPFEIASSFKETFILYEPKEIVAGDFYWIEKNNGKVFLAVCDCTGHGVPGAMLSVVGHNALHRCVNEFNLTDPGKILDKLSAIVEETFSHTYQNVRDGMDISLISFDVRGNNAENRAGNIGSSLSYGEKTKDTGSIEIKWAGANNPIWFITSNGEFKELKGDKQPIGKHEAKKPFTTHTVELNNSDCLYLFSDGFADQFGGPKGKKFKYAKLRELLLAHHTEDMQSQLGVLDGAFNKWKGNLDQIDDVCVIGVRI